MTYVTLYFDDFSVYWEECFYSFECVNRIPEFFERITVPTRDGNFEGVVVDITANAEYPIAKYKI